MFRWRKPDSDVLQRFLAEEARCDLGEVSDNWRSRGIVRHETRLVLGTGEPLFHAAVQGLRRWEQFQLPWAHVWPTDTPLEVGATMAILGAAVGGWWVNACRIVQRIEAFTPRRQFGFVNRALPNHVMRGAERFLIEWNPDTDAVTYTIMAESQVRNPFLGCGAFFIRRLQRRFARESAASFFQRLRPIDRCGRIEQSETVVLQINDLVL